MNKKDVDNSIWIVGTVILISISIFIIMVYRNYKNKCPTIIGTCNCQTNILTTTKQNDSSKPISYTNDTNTISQILLGKYQPINATPTAYINTLFSDCILNGTCDSAITELDLTSLTAQNIFNFQGYKYNFNIPIVDSTQNNGDYTIGTIPQSGLLNEIILKVNIDSTSGNADISFYRLTIYNFDGYSYTYALIINANGALNSNTFGILTYNSTDSTVEPQYNASLLTNPIRSSTIQHSFPVSVTSGQEIRLTVLGNPLIISEGTLELTIK